MSLPNRYLRLKWVILCSIELFCVQLVHGFSAKIEWAPCSVTLDNVSKSYPDTIWRKLTSSTPRREWALDDFSLQASQELLILKGASSSGKSTILRMILGDEEPTKGKVSIDCLKHNNCHPPKPILLDQKPNQQFAGNSKALQSILLESINVHGSNPGLKDSHSDVVVDELASLSKLDLSTKALDLSPSECYKAQILRATIESTYSKAFLSQTENDIMVNIPAPVLLLDEWMDTEPSSIIQNVQNLLETLADQCGATILSVTHKPDFYSYNASRQQPRSITMSRGRVLPDLPRSLS